MEQDLFSQTNQTQLLNTTTTDLHQDKEESPTCTDIDMYDHQPRVNLKSESSSFDNSDLISNGQQLSLENQRQNKEPLLDEENKERNQAMIEKNANSSDGTNENEEANEEEEEIKGEGDNDDFVNKNETVDDDDNSEHISVNESDTLKITLEQNENSNKNNDTTKKKLEEENDCVTSRDELTTSVSASIITSTPSDQIIKNDMDNTATTSTTINKKDNHNDNPINTDSIIPSPSFSISAGPTTSGKNNLKNNELDKDDNHDDETYNITNYNDNDNNINTSNSNGSNDDVTNTDNNEDNLKDQAGSISLLKGDNNNETNTTAISSEQNTSITNEHDNSINTSADVIHSTPSTFITTNNDNDITITNQQHNEDNKEDVKEDEQDEGTTTPTQINKLESMDQQLLSTFVRDENNINEPSNIPPTTTLVDNLPNNGAQSSEQSGNAPEQNTTAILNAQQQDNNNETQVTQIDEHDRNQHYHQSNPSTLSSPLPPPPSQPLLTTSSPPSSELTTTMATATATSTLTISTNTSNDLHHPSDPNNNMNSNNNSSQLQTNNNHQHHQHSITIDQPTPHLLNRTNTYASDEQTLAEPRPRRIWESDRQTSECRKCNRKFNFLVRRHHCRRCGQIFCDRCSSHRIKLPVEEIVEDPMISTSHYPIIALSPQRVCDACIRIPIKADSTSSRYNSSSPSSSSPYGKMVNQLRPAPVNMKRSDSQQSLMAECPVCGTGLLGMRKSQQENHLNQCLNTGSPTVRPPRYIVYTIAEGAAQLGDECPICFEEFQVGHKIARMVCLCSYHKHCLRDWLERGKGCPIHYDSYIQTT